MSNQPFNFRSVFFVPGDSEKKLEKSLTIPADLIVFDLEDSVLPDRREIARRRVVDALSKSAGRPRCVRINPIDSPDCQADLRAVMGGAPDLVMLPKIRSAEDIVALGRLLHDLETDEQLTPGSTRIIAIVTETPEMMFALGDLRNTTDRLAALSWGAEDLSAALGASSNRDDKGAWTFTYELARTQCLLAARASGVLAIDTIHADFRDPDGLRTSCRTACRDGFDGKLAIHPEQVGIINEAFTPGVQEVAQANRVIAAFDANPGKGAVQLDGKMLDLPHLKQARRIVERHRRFRQSQS